MATKLVELAETNSLRQTQAVVPPNYRNDTFRRPKTDLGHSQKLNIREEARSQNDKTPTPSREWLKSFSTFNIAYILFSEKALMLLA